MAHKLKTESVIYFHNQNASKTLEQAGVFDAFFLKKGMDRKEAVIREENAGMLWRQHSADILNHKQG